MAKAKKDKINIVDYVVNHKKEIVIGAVLLVAVIVCIVFLLLNNGDNDKNENENSVGNTEVENVVITEDEIVKTYGVTKEDAINLVKQTINSDNFEYTVTINSNARYVVTVKNILTNSEYKFEVDPMTRQYYEI